MFDGIDMFNCINKVNFLWINYHNESSCESDIDFFIN